MAGYDVCDPSIPRFPLGLSFGLGHSHDVWWGQSRGPHIFQVEPSSNFFNCKAQAIGARSQSARTYLERNLDKFPSSSVDELVNHALRALRDCLPADVELNGKNACLSVVGNDRDFTTWVCPSYSLRRLSSWRRVLYSLFNTHVRGCVG